jgi:hypothetical protein
MPDRFDDTAGVRAKRYRERAAVMRRQAAAAVTASLRVLLLENAELYDKLAEQAERKSREV